MDGRRKCLFLQLLLLVPFTLGLICGDDTARLWRESCFFQKHCKHAQHPRMFRFKRDNSSAFGHSLELVVSLDDCACKSLIVIECREESCKDCHNRTWPNINETRLTGCNTFCWQFNSEIISCMSEKPILPDESCTYQGPTDATSARQRGTTVRTPAGFKESTLPRVSRPGRTTVLTDGSGQHPHQYPGTRHSALDLATASATQTTSSAASSVSSSSASSLSTLSQPPPLSSSSPSSIQSMTADYTTEPHSTEVTDASSAIQRGPTVRTPAGFKKSTLPRVSRPGKTTVLTDGSGQHPHQYPGTRHSALDLATASATQTTSSAASSVSSSSASSLSTLSQPPPLSSSSPSSIQSKTADHTTKPHSTEVTSPLENSSNRNPVITQAVSATVVMLVLVTIATVVYRFSRQRKHRPSPEEPNPKMKKGEPSVWSITVGGEDEDSMLSAATVDGRSCPDNQNDSSSCFTYHGSEHHDKYQSKGSSVSVCMEVMHRGCSHGHDGLLQGLPHALADLHDTRLSVMSACPSAPGHELQCSFPGSSNNERTIHSYYGGTLHGCSLWGGDSRRRVLGSTGEESVVSNDSEEFSPPDNFLVFDHHSFPELYNLLDSFNGEQDV